MKILLLVATILLLSSTVTANYCKIVHQGGVEDKVFCTEKGYDSAKTIRCYAKADTETKNGYSAKLKVLHPE